VVDSVDCESNLVTLDKQFEGGSAGAFWASAIVGADARRLIVTLDTGAAGPGQVGPGPPSSPTPAVGRLSECPS